jgi:N-acetylmuramoyl-L-alanine amidase
MLFFLPFFFCFSLFAEEFVNVRYLETQSGVTVRYELNKDTIEVTSQANSARIVIGYPYIIYGDSVEKLETPPFCENGQIFITQKAYDVIKNSLLPARPQAGNTARATAVVVPAATAAPAPKATAVAAAPKQNRPNPTATPEAAGVRIYDKQAPSRNGRKLIVLDPGHGGNDPGAVGPTKYYEKDAVLDIARRVEKYLKPYKYDVYLTRRDDKFISLKQRAVVANNKDADLFVSIHCNASPNSKVKGTRSYIYSRVASSKAAAEAAKFENKKAGSFEFLLNDLRKNAFEYLSIEAAGYIQQNLVKSLKLKWLPTERAPFYVLANTNMPSVLVETAFISNREEEKKLADAGFRDMVAKGITKGIVEYLSKIE